MKKYRVTFMEKVYHEVYVEADNEEEAEDKKLEEFNNTPVSELIDESLRVKPREKKEPKQPKKATTTDNMQSLNF